MKIKDVLKKKKDKDNFLDELLKAIEDGPLDYGQSVCKDARSMNS